MTLTQIFFFGLTLQLVGVAALAGRLVLSKLLNVRVDSVWFFMGRARWEFLAFGSVIVSIGWVPLGCGMKLLPADETTVLDPPVSLANRVLRQAGVHAGLFPVMLLSSSFLLTVSLYMHGEQAQTLQVTNVKQKSDAMRLDIQRGDVLLSVEGREIQSFDQGRELLKKARGEIELLWERRTGWVDFATLAPLKDWLESRYKAPNYIRIQTTNGGEPAMFYSAQEAFNWMQPRDLRGASAGVSTTAVRRRVEWKAGNGAELGVGIKPFSLKTRHVEYSLAQSARDGFAYTAVLFSLITKRMLHIHNLRVSYQSLGEELYRFVQEVSSMQFSAWIRLLSILCVFWAFFNLLPLPGTVTWSILSLVVHWILLQRNQRKAGTVDV